MADVTTLSKEQVFDWLSEVTDPEIPVLTVTDMGVVRDVDFEGDEVIETITPTYSGCPAMKTIENDIEDCLEKHGIEKYRVITKLSPAWTTDWLTDNGRQKLEEYGIAPPAEKTTDKSAITGGKKVVKCPQCGSTNTEMISQFGSTACKALYKCNDCLEPFDYFKCI
jgi:ring-1,2-phenylacetyl-CoA epoxidase subunit PaaD